VSMGPIGAGQEVVGVLDLGRGGRAGHGSHPNRCMGGAVDKHCQRCWFWTMVTSLIVRFGVSGVPHGRCRAWWAWELAA
jgi:hypothetical protein